MIVVLVVNCSMFYVYSCQGFCVISKNVSTIFVVATVEVLVFMVPEAWYLKNFVSFLSFNETDRYFPLLLKRKENSTHCPF